MSLSKHISFNDLPKAVEDLQNMVLQLLAEVKEIKSAPNNPSSNKLMSRKEVAEYFNCDESTIHNWTKKGKLIKYCISNRTYYKKTEVEAALIKIN